MPWELILCLYQLACGKMVSLNIISLKIAVSKNLLTLNKDLLCRDTGMPSGNMTDGEKWLDFGYI